MNKLIPVLTIGFALLIATGCKTRKDSMNSSDAKAFKLSGVTLKTADLKIKVPEKLDGDGNIVPAREILTDAIARYTNKDGIETPDLDISGNLQLLTWDEAVKAVNEAGYKWTSGFEENFRSVNTINISSDSSEELKAKFNALNQAFEKKFKPASQKSDSAQSSNLVRKVGGVKSTPEEIRRTPLGDVLLGSRSLDVYGNSVVNRFQVFKVDYDNGESKFEHVLLDQIPWTPAGTNAYSTGYSSGRSSQGFPAAEYPYGSKIGRGETGK